MGKESPVSFASVLGAPGAPGPQAAPSPWKPWGDHISYDDGVVIGAPTGDNMGAGTLNAEMLYIQGQNALGVFVEVDGDTMTGPLNLYGDPQAPLEATPKQYVDQEVADALTTAEMVGSEFYGVFNASNGTIIWNSAANQAGNALPAPVAQLEGKYLICQVGGLAPPAGAPATTSYVPGDWLVCNGAAWLHLEIAAGMADIGDTPPANPTPGSLWFDPTSLQLYIYYDDGTSRQWIVTINQAPHMATTFLPLVGGTLTGPLVGTTADFDSVTADQSVLNCTAGTDAALAGWNNAQPRWRMSLVAPQSETGGEVGSNLTFDSFTDAGGYLDTPFSINRKTGKAVMRAASVGSVPVNDTDVVRRMDLDPLAGVVSGFLPFSGGQLTGPLYLAGDPVAVQEAATKQYVDSRVVTPLPPDMSGYMPKSGGAFTGHITVPAPSSGTHAATKTYADTMLPKSGGQMTGFITLHSAPSSANHAATKAYVDGKVPATGSYLPITGGTLTGALHGTTAEFSSTVKSAGKIVNAIGATKVTATPTSGAATLILNKASTGGHQSVLAGYRNNIPRWTIALGMNNSESGGNNGSGLAIANYSDSGANLGLPMQISRAQGATTFSMPISEGSDVRMKSNVETVSNALGIIEQLDGVFYNRDDDPRRYLGLVAQEVQAVLPEVVFEAENWATAEPKGDTPMLALAYGNVVAVLINAIKELNAKVAALEAAR